MDFNLQAFQDEVGRVFGSPSNLHVWVTATIPEESVHNIAIGATLREQVASLFQWAAANGRAPALVQKMVDEFADPQFRLIVSALSGGRIVATAPRTVLRHEDLFVSECPFVNRARLRGFLQTLDAAPAGPNSVIVIGGDRYSGKSYGVRLAIHCAPPDRLVELNLKDWEPNLVTMPELVAVLTGSGDAPAIDITKEAEAVPRLLGMVAEHLKAKRSWIVIDHCSQATLSAPAQALLFKLAEKIERGALAGVKLIIADVDRTKLPGRLPALSQYDRASLPTVDDVSAWCLSLATHLGKSFTKKDADEMAAEALSTMLPTVDATAQGAWIEDQIRGLVPKIHALP